MTTQTLTVCRLTNGTLDIDYYRNRALMERKATMTGSLRKAAPLGLLVWIVMMACVFMTTPSAPRLTAANGAAAPITVVLATR